MSSAPRIQINGRPAEFEQIWAIDGAQPGHFTAMQVVGGQTLGLDFHLVRLDSATRELWGVGLDADLVRGYLRLALADGIADASLRVNVFRAESSDDLSVVVSLRPPGSAPVQRQSLQTVPYQRPAAHIKHSTGFGQSYFQGLAQGNGYDEALFVGADGAVSEGSITNIGFLAGDAIVWPDAPALAGVMMQVLQRELTIAGVPWRHEPVHAADLASFDGAFLTNARGFATVARIDEMHLPTDADLMRMAAELLAAAAYDPIG